MRIALHNRQRAVQVDLPRLQALSVRAASECLPHQGRGETLLGTLDAVEISIVSDRIIAQVHRQFLRVKGATDVITFQHGEILVSATMAARRAALEQETTNRELARYIVHGLLHLNGHLDEVADDAAAMWQAQEQVLESIWPVA